MTINTFRYGFALLWLVTALVILFRGTLGVTWFDGRWSDETLAFVVVISFALAVRNAFRAWMQRQKERGQPAERPNPLRPREENRPFEYNPELDFHKPS